MMTAKPLALAKCHDSTFGPSHLSHLLCQYSSNRLECLCWCWHL